ncbi:hypothetical protein NPIL_244771 [Nephila pilipes]|uniref:Uncharacterized protein n=1 Tax=Nephila pilipes TaxID=299642 RepID=A0A8X6UCE9_NEPPI|nr:hypothetical protein NPIL_244771 [Nephila pilipes]
MVQSQEFKSAYHTVLPTNYPPEFISSPRKIGLLTSIIKSYPQTNPVHNAMFRRSTLCGGGGCRCMKPERGERRSLLCGVTRTSCFLTAPRGDYD